MTNTPREAQEVWEAHLQLHQSWQQAGDEARSNWLVTCPREARERVAAESMRLLTTPRLSYSIKTIFGDAGAETARAALVAEVVLRISSRGEPPKLASGAIGYLYRVLSNLVADEGRRARRKHAEIPEGSPDAALPAAEPEESEHSLEALLKARDGMRLFLANVIVPQARADNRLLECFDRLWKLQLGEQHFDELVAEIASAEAQPGAAPDRRKVSNRLHRGHTDLRAKLQRELVGQLKRISAGGARELGDDHRRRMEQYALWLELVSGFLRDRSASRVSPRHVNGSSTDGVGPPASGSEDNMAGAGVAGGAGMGGSTTRMDEVVAALTLARVLLNRPYRRVGDVVRDAPVYSDRGTGRGFATAEVWDDEELDAKGTAADAEGDWLHVAALSGLHSQPFLLTRSGSAWSVVVNRTQSGTPRLSVVSLGRDGVMILNNAEIPAGGMRIPNGSGEPLGCMARYDGSGAGIFIRLEGEEALVQLLLPPAEPLAVRPTLVRFVSPFSQIFDDPLLTDATQLLAGGGGSGPLRAAAIVLRTAGAEHFRIEEPADAIAAIERLLDQTVERLLRGLDDVLDAIEPSDRSWIALVTQLLEDRELAAGLHELSHLCGRPYGGEALQEWDDAAKYEISSLPGWMPGDEADWLLAIRGARGTSLPGESLEWWLDLTWCL